MTGSVGPIESQTLTTDGTVHTAKNEAEAAERRSIIPNWAQVLPNRSNIGTKGPIALAGLQC